jgi:hypothetical protein
MNQFTYHWDDLAKVPYLTGNGSLHTFVSFDDERSIAEKARYIVDNDLRGAIIWEITGDYIETSPGSGVVSGTPLADTLNNVFCHYTGEPNTAGIVTSDESSVQVFPNPGSTVLHVNGNSDLIGQIVISDISGQIFLEQLFIPSKETVIDVSGLVSGVYFIRITTDNGSVHKQVTVLNR